MQWSSVSLELQYIWLWSDSPSACLEMQYISLSGAAIHQHLYSCRASAYKSCSASASLELQCICVSRASSHPSLGLQHLSLSLSLELKYKVLSDRQGENSSLLQLFFSNRFSSPPWRKLPLLSQFFPPEPLHTLVYTSWGLDASTQGLLDRTVILHKLIMHVGSSLTSSLPWSMLKEVSMNSTLHCLSPFSFAMEKSVSWAHGLSFYPMI